MSLRGPPGERSPAELLSFGVVNLDKPPGPSAHQVTGWLRDAVDDALTARGTEGIDDAAHSGTLDPKVTGCLPVLTGTATRLARVFLEGRKEYVAVLECHDRVPDDLAAVAGEFEGPIYQKPPRRSAVRRDLRVREVHALDVLERGDRRALLRIECESGTYVRKLCHDLGLALGTGAHMGDLRRTGTEPFDDRDLVDPHDLIDALAFWREDGDSEPLRAVVDPAERALAHLPRVTIAESAAREVIEGAPVYAPGVLGVEGVDGPPDCEGDGATGEGVGAAGEGDGEKSDGRGGGGDAPLVACYTPDGAAVCLGRLVGDPDADSGTVVDLERVLV